ncbi:hypothetical protein H6F61_21890 [Cyanobacteria bacterium FACHB-472]|jgi:hypothetical protein|nr:hypothetical protein [Cyanobacteria bacterium FACHB-472]
MLQISGYWLLLTSLVHVLVGLWLFAEPLAEIAGNGWFNAVAPDPFNPYFDREDAFWFMMATPSIFTAGLLCFWAQAKQFPLPSFLGWILLTTATVGCLIEPISGFWLLIPPGFLILAASRK